MQGQSKKGVSLTGNYSNSVYSDKFVENNLIDESIITIGLTGSGADHTLSSSDDLGAFITNFITGENKIINIFNGTYNLTSRIYVNYSNVKIYGSSRENVKIQCAVSNKKIIEINKDGAGSGINNVTIQDLTIDNTNYSNTGAIGIYCNGLRKCNIIDVNIDNCYTALKIDNRNFFNSFERIRTNMCYDTLVITGPDATHKPNQNTFLSCLFNNNYNTICNIEKGNVNVFCHCSFENWANTAIVVDDANANCFNDCRLECNSIGLPPSYYINLTSNSAENVFRNNYYTDGGASWIDYDTSILDNGTGNCLDSLNSYKDQKIVWKKGGSTARNFVDIIREGSGDNKYIMRLEDQYANSGNPIQLQIYSNRGTGKFIDCIFNNAGTPENKFFVNNDGTVMADKIYLGVTDTYIKNITSSNMVFYVNSLERMKINSGGTVDIHSKLTIGGELDANSYGSVQGNFDVGGILSKGGGTFRIPHPDSIKREQKMWLRHSFVESNTAGDNLYRFKIITAEDNQSYILKMPDYSKYLNKNLQCWITPIGQFAQSYVESIDDNYVTIKCEKAGAYNVLIIGTRKDPIAVNHFNEEKGAECYVDGDNELKLFTTMCKNYE